MTKTSRLALIRQAARRHSRFVSGVLFAANLATLGRADEKDAARRVSTLTSERLPAMNDSIAETDNVELTVSRLSATEDEDSTGESRSLSSYLLTPAERKMVAHEWRRKVAPAPVTVADPDPLPSDFIPAPVEPFVSAFAGIAEPNAFELAIADLPLQLMPAPVLLLLAV